MQYPNKQLENIIVNSDLSLLSKDYAELAIDRFLDDGVFKDIPLLGTLMSVLKFSNSINKLFTFKKLYKFLFELNSLSQEKRNKKIEEINKSRKYQSTVGEMIFELLDKIESDGKPEIIGKLFAAVIEEKIDYETYLRLAYIVKNIFYYDLIWLVENTNGEKVNGNINDSLITNGLATMDFVNNFETSLTSDNSVKSYATMTELGKILINIGMK